MSKKEIKKEELEVANGGTVTGEDYMICSHCGKRTTKQCCESREIHEGCSIRYEYKCPFCGEWF